MNRKLSIKEANEKNKINRKLSNMSNRSGNSIPSNFGNMNSNLNFAAEDIEPEFSLNNNKKKNKKFPDKYITNNKNLSEINENNGTVNNQNFKNSEIVKYKTPKLKNGEECIVQGKHLEYYYNDHSYLIETLSPALDLLDEISQEKLQCEINFTNAIIKGQKFANLYKQFLKKTAETFDKNQLFPTKAISIIKKVETRLNKEQSLSKEDINNIIPKSTLSFLKLSHENIIAKLKSNSLPNIMNLINNIRESINSYLSRDTSIIEVDLENIDVDSLIYNLVEFIILYLNKILVISEEYYSRCLVILFENNLDLIGSIGDKYESYTKQKKFEGHMNNIIDLLDLLYNIYNTKLIKKEEEEEKINQNINSSKKINIKSDQNLIDLIIAQKSKEVLILLSNYKENQYEDKEDVIQKLILDMINSKLVSDYSLNQLPKFITDYLNILITYEPSMINESINQIIANMNREVIEIITRLAEKDKEIINLWYQFLEPVNINDNNFMEYIKIIYFLIYIFTNATQEKNNENINIIQNEIINKETLVKNENIDNSTG